MIIARRTGIVVFFILCSGGFRAAIHAQGDTVLDPKISFRSLTIQSEKFFRASEDETKDKLARSILDIGDDLVRGPMKPSKADSVAEAAKAGTALPEQLKPYRGFWMLRAAAAAQADDTEAGEQAAAVLKKLGPPNPKSSESPENSSYLDVMAGLNVKGWLTGRSNRTTASSETVDATDEDYPYAIPTLGNPDLAKVHIRRANILA